MKARIFLIHWFFLFVLLGNACGQTMRQDSTLEDTVATMLDRLNQISEYNSGKAEKAEDVDSLITTSLLDGLNRSSSSISYPFKKLKALNMNILSSSDGHIRFYCWNSRTGGTMIGVSTIAQYKTAHGVHAKVLFDAATDTSDEPGVWFTRIHTFRSRGAAYYLALGSAVFSTRDQSAVARAFRIGTDGLDDSVRIFLTEEGLTNKIEITFDLSKSSAGYESAIRFDTSTGQLLVRRVVAERLMTKCDLYRFKGKYFARN